MLVDTDGKLMTSGGSELTTTNLVYRNHETAGDITTGAYTTILAASSDKIRQLHIFDSSGQGLILATGAAASETDVLYIPPGGFNGPINLYIASGTRLSLKALTATVDVGDFIMTALR
jgi:hypothetical protein